MHLELYSEFLDQTDTFLEDLRMLDFYLEYFVYILYIVIFLSASELAIAFSSLS